MATPPATEMQEPAVRRDWNAVAAIIASLIGLLALCVSGYTAWLQRQQVRAQVWPYLQTAISPSRRTMSVENKGVGPAQVRNVKVYVDGKAITTWPKVFDAIDLHDLRNTPPSTLSGIVISAGETVQQMGMPDSATFARFYREYPRIQLAVCYCSALDECWLMDDHAVPRKPRDAVTSCPAADADTFVDNLLLPAPVASK